MSHLSQGFTGMWHLMTFAEDAPLLGPAASALAEMAKTPGDLSQAVVIGAKVYSSLVQSHAEMLDEDKQIIPTVLHTGVRELKTKMEELADLVNGRPGRPGHPLDPLNGFHVAIPDVEPIPPDPTKQPAYDSARKAYLVAEAAVQTALAQAA